jgi:sarcosine oxidase subunit beta
MGFTADGLPLIGRYDGAEGILVSAGFNGGGFSWTLAAGSVVADLVATGATSYDIEPFDPNRFERHGVAWDNPFTAGERNNPRRPAVAATSD